MVQGYETRGETADPFQNFQDSGLKDQEQSTSGINGPKNPDLEGVGQSFSTLSSLFGASSELMNQYVEKKKDQWRVEGQLAFAQGKTQEQLNANGMNQFTTEGYQGMQMSTALQKWKQSKLIGMTQGDEQKSPDQYRKELQDSFNGVIGNLQSPYVKKLVAAQSERDLPDILSTQMVHHAKFVEEQTEQSAQGLISSASDLAHTDPSQQHIMIDAVNHIEHTLRKEQSTKVLAQAMKMGLESDNPSLRDYLVGKHGTASVPAVSQDSIINYEIDHIEGASPIATKDNNGYLVKYGINQKENPDVDVKNLTREQAVDIYKKKYWDKASISKLSPEMQAAAFDTVVNHGISGGGNLIAQAGGDVSKLHDLRLSEYKRLNASGKSEYANLAAWENRLEKVANIPPPSVTQGMERNDIAASLFNQGFKAEEVQSIIIASKEHDSRKIATFDQQRLQNEDRIKAQATSTGNLPAMYSEIEKTMKANSYSAQWGNGMVNDVREGVKVYQKNATEQAELGSALANKTVALLPEEKQRKALTLGLAQDKAIIAQAYQKGEYNDEAAQRKITPEQVAQEKIQGSHLSRLVDNHVVDKTVAEQLQQDIRGISTLKASEIKDPSTGKLTPAGEKAVNSIGMYYQLRSMKGSSTGFARKFLDDDSAKLMNEVIARDSTGQNLVGALMDASAILYRPANMKIPPINVQAMKQDVSKYVEDNLNPGFFDWMTGGAANVGPFDVHDAEVEAWKKDPVLNATAAQVATRYKTANPEVSTGAAIQEAMAQLRNRGDFVGGSFLMAPEGKTMKQLAGLSDVQDPLIMHKATMEYMQKFGSDMWPNYNDVQLVSRPDLNSFNDNKGVVQTLFNLPRPSISKMGASVADLYRGVPEAAYSYNPSNDSIVVKLYRNKEGTVLNPLSREIPVKEIGDLWREQHSNPTLKDTAIKGAKATINEIIP